MKCVCGNPMREHIVALDDVWWICIICGREKPAEVAPAVIPTRLEKPDNHRFDCPTCGRNDVLRVNADHCMRCYKRIQRENDPVTNMPVLPPALAPAILADDEPTTLEKPLINGESTQIYVLQDAVQIKEEAMSKKVTPHGTCPICKRENVLMPGPKCSRCYYRIAHGQDPITGKPVAVAATGDGTHDFTEDLRAALAKFKFKKTEIDKVLADDQILAAASLEEAIRLALKNIKHTPPTLSITPTQAKSAPPAVVPGSRPLDKLDKLDKKPVDLGQILFAEDCGLLQIMEDAARCNRRSLAGEILYRLDRSLEAA